MARPAMRWWHSTRRRPAAFVAILLLSAGAVLVSAITPMLLGAVDAVNLRERVAEAPFPEDGVSASGATLEADDGLAGAQAAVYGVLDAATSGDLWSEPQIVSEPRVAPYLAGPGRDPLPVHLSVSPLDCDRIRLTAGRCPDTAQQLVLPTALRGIDLVVDDGQRVALLGPSGSGKSTLFAIVAGIMRPSPGSVVVFGTDLATAGRRAMRRVRGTTLGLMLQGAGRNLLPYEDALGNVRAAVDLTGHAELALGRSMLEAGGVAAHGGPVQDLAPRDQQVVALASAVSTRPRLLLADEPTSRLDDVARDRVLDLLLDVTAREGISVLVVTHDPVVAGRMQQMIHLRDGRIAEEATEAGRYAVIGTDLSLQLPVGVQQAGWAAGDLVSIDHSRPGEIRITPAGGPGRRS